MPSPKPQDWFETDNSPASPHASSSTPLSSGRRRPLVELWDEVEQEQLQEEERTRQRRQLRAQQQRQKGREPLPSQARVAAEMDFFAPSKPSPQPPENPPEGQGLWELMGRKS